MTVVRPALAALKMLLVLTLILGVLYPLGMTAVGRLMPGRADGSLLVVNGAPVGSSLLAQNATDAKWFHTRPSVSDAAGDTSGGSNLGPNEPDQAQAVADRVAAQGRADSGQGLFDDAWAREQKDETGLPGGIAIPHAKSASVTTPSPSTRSR